jgi:hypothetical protein|mmetsp:Transcript_111955/g.176821  ORF Transcript_111955/g.176821 Transcript_111955/m.176821 type:complete len:131 (+) Transcript_111955:1207-1599(+)
MIKDVELPRLRGRRRSGSAPLAEKSTRRIERRVTIVVPLEAVLQRFFAKTIAAGQYTLVSQEVAGLSTLVAKDVLQVKLASQSATRERRRTVTQVEHLVDRLSGAYLNILKVVVTIRSLESRGRVYLLGS